MTEITTLNIEVQQIKKIVNHIKENDLSKNIIFKSSVPKICLDEPCKLGVDEAGRGPVLGPMVYGISYCPISKEEDLKSLECADSKTLTEKKREEIFETLSKNSDFIGWMVEVISPNFICNKMLQRQKHSLNQVSQDSAVALIQGAIDSGVNVTEVYVDTVGMPEKYQEKLSMIFPQLKITVAKKADSLYPIVSAASICAKVTRDFAVENWVFSEKMEVPEDLAWGSGYPGDPATIKFLKGNIDPVFGFPQLVRFSWSTAQKLLDEHANLVEWSDEEEEDKAVKNNTSITSFFKSSVTSKRMSRAQESGVATLLGNTTTTSNTNGTATANAEKDIKPLDIKETLLATPEVKSAQEGNVSVEVKITSNLTEISSPVEKEDPQIAAKQIKGGEGLKTPLIAEPDAVKKDLGGRCSADKDCLTVNNTYCKDNICVCNNGYIPSKHSLDKCIKVPSGLFDACEEDAQCSHAVTGSECREGNCNCPLNYVFKSSRCWEKQMLGGLCNFTEQCEDVPSALCMQGVCDCKSPLTPSSSNKCLEVAGKQYKAACEEDIQCSLSYGDEARCSHGQCRCTNGYHYNGTTCIIDKKLGDPCSADTDCEVSEVNNQEASRVCLDKICTCASGYSSLPGEDICSKSGGSKLAMSLSWILCFILAKFYLE